MPGDKPGTGLVGLVAEKHLSNKARKVVLRILEDNSLAEVSNWMGDVKSDANFNHTHDWHWVTISDGMTYDQTTKNPKGDLIMKIEELTIALKSKSLSAEKERESLKFLIHLSEICINRSTSAGKTISAATRSNYSGSVSLPTCTGSGTVK